MPVPLAHGDWPYLKAKPWSQLDRDELHALLRLRIDVFVPEQDARTANWTAKI